MKKVACLIPSATGTEHILGTLFGVVNQEVPPLRIIVADTSEKRIASTVAVKRWCRQARIDVLDLPAGTNLQRARDKLVGAVGPGFDFFWFVDDDLWPTYKCLSTLLSIQEETGAVAVVGLKKEVTRKNVFRGKDWNLAGDSIRVQQIPWCDGANWLVKEEEGRKCMYAGVSFLDKHNKMTGEDILSTAKCGSEHLCVSAPGAVAYHMPLTEERWNDLDGSDDFVLESIKHLPEEHVGWMKRTLDQSDWW